MYSGVYTVLIYIFFYFLLRLKLYKHHTLFYSFLTEVSNTTGLLEHGRLEFRFRLKPVVYERNAHDANSGI